MKIAVTRKGRAKVIKVRVIKGGDEYGLDD